VDDVLDVWEKKPEAAADSISPEDTDVCKSCVDDLNNYFDPAKCYFFERYKICSETGADWNYFAVLNKIDFDNCQLQLLK
jgi:hydrogenase maturation factor HypF (carbamoyltransferase family)